MCVVKTDTHNTKTDMKTNMDVVKKKLKDDETRRPETFSKGFERIKRVIREIRR